MERDAGDLWRRRVIRLKMFLVQDEAPFSLRVVVGTHVINERAIRVEAKPKALKRRDWQNRTVK